MSTEPSAPQHANAAGADDGIEYVVQRRQPGAGDVDGHRIWGDIAVLTVPKRSQTSTIVLAAIKQSGVHPTLTDRFRVLDGKAARELMLKAKEQPEPEYQVSVVVDGQQQEVPED